MSGEQHAGCDCITREQHIRAMELDIAHGFSGGPCQLTHPEPDPGVLAEMRAERAALKAELDAWRAR